VTLPSTCPLPLTLAVAMGHPIFYIYPSSSFLFLFSSTPASLQLQLSVTSNSTSPHLTSSSTTTTITINDRRSTTLPHQHLQHVITPTTSISTNIPLPTTSLEHHHASSQLPQPILNKVFFKQGSSSSMTIYHDMVLTSSHTFHHISRTTSQHLMSS